MKHTRALATLLAALVLTAPLTAWASGGGGTEELVTNTVFHAINLAILLGLGFYFGRAPLKKMLQNRKSQITKDLEEAARLRDEARQLLERYEGKLSSLDTEKEEILRDYRAVGESERDRLIAQARQQAEKIVQDAELTVENEIRQAKTALEREVLELASELAEQKIRARLDESAHNQIFDSYLQDIEQQYQA